MTTAMLSKPQVDNTLCTITPSLAAEWIAAAHPNRRIQPHRVNLIVAALKAGEWRVNGESIKFDEDNLMIDGQHRLQAIIQSGINMDTYVMRGLPRGSFDTIDIGKPRSAADILFSLGHTQTTALAAALRQMRVLDCLMETGFYFASGGSILSVQHVRLTPAHARSLIAEHQCLPEWINRARELRRAGLCGGDGFWAGTLYWLSISLVDAEEDALGFHEGLVSGAGFTSGDPILTLRNRLLAAKGQSLAERLTAERIAAFVIKAWNAYRRGEKLMILKWSRGGANKESFPRPV